MLRRALRLMWGTAALVAGGWVLRALNGAPAALGAGPVDINAVAANSPNYHDGLFVNLEPPSGTELSREQQAGLVRDLLASSALQRPPMPIPLVVPDPGLPAGDLAVTWFGHSSALLEVDGVSVLVDPVWSDRVSPSQQVGPKR